MLTEESIKKDLDLIVYFLTTCKKLTLDSYYMLMTNSSDKFTVIRREPFLMRVRETCWKMAIIELSKLYVSNKKNNHSSISVFISILSAYHSTADWKDKITFNELKTLALALDTEEVKAKILKLKELRDQHYAHTDKDPKHHISEVKFYYEDCLFLIEKAEEIVQKLALHFGLKVQFHEYKGEEMNNFLDKYMQRSLDAAKYKMANNEG